jgi:hypothetical protein
LGWGLLLILKSKATPFEVFPLKRGRLQGKSIEKFISTVNAYIAFSKGERKAPPFEKGTLHLAKQCFSWEGFCSCFH